MTSRSFCPLGQGEGDTSAVVVALAQPARRIVAVEEATNRATACGRGAARSTAVKGRRGEAWRTSASAGRTTRSPRLTPNRMASRSVCPFGQNEGDTGAVAVALAQPARWIVAVEEATNRATACGRRRGSKHCS